MERKKSFHECHVAWLDQPDSGHSAGLKLFVQLSNESYTISFKLIALPYWPGKLIQPAEIEAMEIVLVLSRRKKQHALIAARWSKSEEKNNNGGK